jgi:hypothetical protein
VVDDPGGVVELVAAHRQREDGHAGGQRLDHGAVPGVGDRDGGVLEHPAVRRAAHDGDLRGRRATSTR